jgi:cold shock protein
MTRSLRSWPRSYEMKHMPHGARASFALVSLREDATFVEGAMTIGTVRWFDVRKGYGFLKPDDDGVDVLVDVCAVERAGMASLNQGQRLSFEVVYDKRIGRSCAENLGAFGLQAGARIDIALPFDPRIDPSPERVSPG